MMHIRIYSIWSLLVLITLLFPSPAVGQARSSEPAEAARLTPEQAIIAATSDMEVGANDFRLSDMGQDTTYDAYRPAIAYNSTDNEYLVVWYGDNFYNDTPANGEYEIYAQRVDAASGAEISAELRLSDLGPDGDAAYDAYSPAVAYNSVDNEYLVVWHGDDNTALLVDEEYEIFGQRVEANTGAEIGSDLRLSDMGPNSDPAYDAWVPAVAYNSTENEYLVVWHGDDNTAPLVDDELEIFGQRVNATTGVEIGVDFQISAMGPNGIATYEAIMPAVTYNNTGNEYLVVWHADDKKPPLVDDEFEVYGQRLDAAGNQVGYDDVRLSDMGPDGDPDYSGGFPDIAYNSAENEYLIVWTGDDDTGWLADDELEIYGQLVDAATGTEVGTNDFRLSDMGSDGSQSYGADQPAVVYNSQDNEYLVAWYGDDNTTPLVEGEEEVFGQRVNAKGTEVGTNDFRLSDMGPDGDPDYAANDPALAYNSTGSQYLVIWEGDDNTPPLVDKEYEIHGQRVDGATGAELGADQRLSHVRSDEETTYKAWFEPAVAYNSANNEYLVVWGGSDNAPPLMTPEMEIYCQRVDAASGAEVGANDFRISGMGPDGDQEYGAGSPAVAYNSADNEYLVVWYGVDDLAGMALNETEIYGQRLDAATGVEVGANDFLISSMGPLGDADYIAWRPGVAYNSIDNQYLVIWEGEDNTPPLVEDEFEIFGQLLYADGGRLGPDGFRLSDMGPDGDTSYVARYPAVAYNSVEGEYLVVWHGDDDTGTLVKGEDEIYGQRIEASTGVQIGTDLRLSDTGPDGNADYDAHLPAVAYNSNANEYLVTWHGDDNTPPLADEEFEVYGQRLDGATGAEIGVNDFRLSDMGSDGDAAYGGVCTSVAYNSPVNEYLVVWYGDDGTPPLVNSEFEIFGQRLNGDNGAEIGVNDFRLSDMGPDGDPIYSAIFPALAHNSMDNEYLVVWFGDDNTAPLVEGEIEIFGQRLGRGGWRLHLPLVWRGGD
ncbi:MAG: hypothetical protein JW726_16545 [Anaerolineales bacterium]|nr:hypothetical protein [Anaerolineales bacterium]